MFTQWLAMALGLFASSAFSARDLNPNNISCSNLEGVIMSDYVVGQKRADGDYDLRVGHDGAATESFDKKYIAKGYIGKQSGELTFSDGKFGIREVSGATNQIGRIWMNGKAPIDVECNSIPPVPPRE